MVERNAVARHLPGQVSKVFARQVCQPHHGKPRQVQEDGSSADRWADEKVKAPKVELTGRTLPMQWYITSEDKAILSYILNNQEYSKVTENGRGAGGKRSKLEHTSYLSHRSPIHRWRKNDHVEKFQISIHNRCGEIRNFARFGGFSKFYTWQMWRNLKFILFLVVKSVLWQFTLFFA